LSRFERKLGDKSGYSEDKEVARLGFTALPLLALLSCRGVVHKSYDATIARAGRMLLALQRSDGGFYPELDLKTGKPRGDHQPLFAAGQGVFAFTLLEAWAPAQDKAVYRDAAERAMQYYAGPYWHSAPYDFFFLEENWHCLAARAALSTHRNDAYERFCLDYVTAKERLVFDENDGPRALSGGYGVSPLFPPHNTATAGYGEALAAAISVRRARHMPVKHQLDVMGRVVGFLTRNQWRAESCFACVRPADTVGGFSESSTSPIMRIDYAQHAWSAIGYGARELARREASD
jgi:hypothetical protein